MPPEATRTGGEGEAPQERRPGPKLGTWGRAAGSGGSLTLDRLTGAHQARGSLPPLLRGVQSSWGGDKLSEQGARSPSTQGVAAPWGTHPKL